MTAEEVAAIESLDAQMRSGLWNQTQSMQVIGAPECRLTFHGGLVVAAPPAEWLDVLRPGLDREENVRFRVTCCRLATGAEREIELSHYEG